MSRHKKILKKEKKIMEAKDVIKKHGYHYVFYMPDFGCRDEELSRATLVLVKNGYIIVDDNGRLTGAISTTDDRTRHMGQPIRSASSVSAAGS